MTEFRDAADRSRPLTGLAARQARLNRSVASNWGLFASHRRRVTELVLTQAPPAGGALCVLGAGNCNDLNLPTLAGRFHEVHLVDLDGDALKEGIRRQSVASSSRIISHPGVDVTGAMRWLDAWSSKLPAREEIDACLLALDTLPEVPVAGGSADVVLSAALLSQLVGAAVRVLGTDHPRTLEVGLSLRDAHLSLLLHLAAPGGTCILVTDVASSTARPDLAGTTPEQLPSLMRTVVAEAAFLPGTSAPGIETALREDPRLAPHVAALTRHDPWLWNLTPTKVQLVYAISFRRV